MTSSARDVRYGRRGGGWAETFDGASCATCRNGTAHWLATLDTEPDAPWPVCNTCKLQAERLTVLVSHELLVVA